MTYNAFKNSHNGPKARAKISNAMLYIKSQLHDSESVSNGANNDDS